MSNLFSHKHTPSLPPSRPPSLLPQVGDKIYGTGNGDLYVKFVRHGWTDQHEVQLGLRRQALHCAALDFSAAEGAADPGYPLRHRAVMPADLVAVCRARMNMDPDEVQTAVEAALAGLDDVTPASAGLV